MTAPDGPPVIELGKVYRLPGSNREYLASGVICPDNDRVEVWFVATGTPAAEAVRARRPKDQTGRGRRSQQDRDRVIT